MASRVTKTLISDVHLVKNLAKKKTFERQIQFTYKKGEAISITKNFNLNR